MYFRIGSFKERYQQARYKNRLHVLGHLQCQRDKKLHHGDKRIDTSTMLLCTNHFALKCHPFLPIFYPVERVSSMHVKMHRNVIS